MCSLHISHLITRACLRDSSYPKCLQKLYKGSLFHTANDTSPKSKTLFEEVLPDPNTNLVYLLVQSKASEALAKNVLVEYEYHDIYMINISCTDFAIVLGNAPDNAIDAASANESAEKRTVQLIIKVKEEQIIVIVKNLTAKASTYA